MATFRDLPSELQAMILKKKDDLEERDVKLREWYNLRKTREMLGLIREFYDECGLSIQGSTDDIVYKYRNDDMMLLVMLKAKLRYEDLKTQKFEDQDWDDFEIPTPSDDEDSDSDSDSE
jgi:hypothetical protein